MRKRKTKVGTLELLKSLNPNPGIVAPLQRDISQSGSRSESSELRIDTRRFDEGWSEVSRKRARFSFRHGEPHPMELYEKKSLVRESLQGKIVRATRINDGRNCVLKISRLVLQRDNISSDGELVAENFDVEVDILKSLPPHKNLVQFLDTYTTNNHKWVVLEDAAAGDLSDLCSNSPPALASIRRFAVDLYSALAHIHQHHVCHLDVSLENLLIGADGRLRLCDFGVAQRFGLSPVVKGNSDARLRPGKVGLMAPEVYCGQAFDGRKADVYSAGVCILTMLCRSAAYQEPSQSDGRFSALYNAPASAVQHFLSHCYPSDQVDECEYHLFDFLSRILCCQSTRLTAEEAMRHPWLAPIIDTCDVEVN